MLSQGKSTSSGIAEIVLTYGVQPRQSTYYTWVWARPYRRSYRNAGWHLLI